MPELDHAVLGRQVAHYRREAKLSAEELATRAGVGLTRSIVANLENGRKRDLSVQQLIAVALVLGVSPADLVFDIRRPYDLVVLGDRDAPENYTSVTTGQVLARSWFGGNSVAPELCYRDHAIAHDEPEDLPHLPINNDAFTASTIQRLLDRRGNAAYALEAHERHLSDVRVATQRKTVIRGGNLPNDEAILTTRIRDFRAELYEIDRQLRSQGVDIDTPITYPGPPF